MTDYRMSTRSYALQPSSTTNSSGSKRLVTFQAEKNDHTDQLEEIRRKYAFRKHAHLPVQNPEPNDAEDDSEHDDSPIHRIAQLGTTPESSPIHGAPSAHELSLGKQTKQKEKKEFKLVPQKVPSTNHEQIEKIDQINHRIKAILQNIKETPEPATSLKPSNVNMKETEGIAMSKNQSSYVSSRPRQDTENCRPPSPASALKNKPRISLMRNDSTKQQCSNQQLKAIYSKYGKAQPKDSHHHERRMSFRDNIKVSLPLHLLPHEEPKQSLTSRRDSTYIPQSKQGTQGTQMQALLKALARQVELDRDFRQAKYTYSEVRDKQKIDNVISVMSRWGIRFNKDTLVRQLQVTQAEYNPFYKAADNPVDYEQLAECYKASHDHWQQYIQGKFNRHRLLEQGIKRQMIFSGASGHISLQDLVRFISSNSQGSLRNRDLILIWRRLSRTDKLTFQDFMNQLCKQ